MYRQNIDKKQINVIRLVTFESVEFDIDYQ